MFNWLTDKARGEYNDRINKLNKKIHEMELAHDSAMLRLRTSKMECYNDQKNAEIIYASVEAKKEQSKAIFKALAQVGYTENIACVICKRVSSPELSCEGPIGKRCRDEGYALVDIIEKRGE